MPKDKQTRILDALKTLETEGLSNKLDIKKLQGYQHHYRIRIGKLVSGYALSFLWTER